MDAPGAAVIAAALDGLSAPVPESAAGKPDRRGPARRRHDALIELGRRQLQSGELPATGGIKPRIVITIPLSSLTGPTGAARLNDGHLIPPSLARYLGCDADIIPAFTDQAGTVIDLGRPEDCSPTWNDPNRTPILNPMHHPPPT